MAYTEALMNESNNRWISACRIAFCNATAACPPVLFAGAGEAVKQEVQHFISLIIGIAHLGRLFNQPAANWLVAFEIRL